MLMHATERAQRSYEHLKVLRKIDPQHHPATQTLAHVPLYVSPHHHPRRLKFDKRMAVPAVAVTLIFGMVAG
jgi:hypothetical protein